MISAIGANAKSNNLYSKTKGEVELAVIQEQLDHLRILRPSLLKGPRDEFRIKEEIGNLLSVILTPIFHLGLRKYQPIEISELAHVLYQSVNDEIPTGSVSLYKNIELLAY